MATYSFLDVQASINGPGGAFQLGNGAQAAEEGITVTMAEEKSTMTIGADGGGMHSLHASKAGQVTVRLLKTSPVNQQLAQMYASQTSTSTLHGQNTILVVDLARGDTISCRQVAFRRQPTLTYAKDGGMNEWEFDAVIIDMQLGSGAPSF